MLKSFSSLAWTEISSKCWLRRQTWRSTTESWRCPGFDLPWTWEGWVQSCNFQNFEDLRKVFQAKVILGFTASVGLEEMSIELIHQKFMAKLQLVTIHRNMRYVLRKCANNQPTYKRDESIVDYYYYYRLFSQEKNGSTHINQSNSQASQDIHEVGNSFSIVKTINVTTGTQRIL